MTHDADDTPPQLALRRWRAEMTDPRSLAAMAGIGVILGLAGPFGTQEDMGLVSRLAYWVTVTVLGYGTGSAVAQFVAPHLPARWPRPLRLTLAGVAVGLAVSVFVLALNIAIFGRHVADPVAMARLAATIVPVAVVVTLLLSLLPQETAAPPSAGPPPILQRLPVAKRGALLALSVEDHYVRVRTTRGEEMVLMRLGDAMNETGDLPGAQVHRSHWVAWGAVTAARREGDRAILTLRGGSEIPVSRANVPAVRAAGLLPR
ncbi:LytTR family DNA-binding domain-containing protein [Wenxinia marina]|nr:LytTR family DNA-binding domain-containing protein [Wenxinia marina]